MNEEFEKWYNKKYPLPPTIERGPMSCAAKNQALSAWKEAMRVNRERLNLLSALEAAGVDNWEGYDEAVEILDEN
ncbi:hypothetical protein LCGC14_2973170 [marine sediment metagenome]|uniref:Uncharacterized protein n=1 Tax=marine sediment metagenome TaxID=412755 RepID=A0A0F8X9Q1_9ZZZZ